MLPLGILVLTAALAQGSIARDQAIDYMCLVYASQAGDEDLVRALLDRGAPVDVPDPDSAGSLSYHAHLMDSPLQVAAENGHLAVVELLLARDPWVDHRCCDRPAALGLAAEHGHLEIVKVLLRAGADPTIVSTYTLDVVGTPLEAARHQGHDAVVNTLEDALLNPAE